MSVIYVFLICAFLYHFTQWKVFIGAFVCYLLLYVFYYIFIRPSVKANEKKRQNDDFEKKFKVWEEAARIRRHREWKRRKMEEEKSS